MRHHIVEMFKNQMSSVQLLKGNIISPSVLAFIWSAVFALLVLSFAADAASADSEQDCMQFVAKGQMYMQVSGGRLKALGEFDKAIQLCPKCARARYARSQYFNSVRSYKQALHDLDAAIYLNPQMYKNEKTLAERKAIKIAMHMERGKYHLASAQNPLFEPPLYDPPEYSTRADDFEQAVGELSTVLAIDPENFEALFDRARAFTGLRQYDKALADVDASLSLNNRPDCYGLRAYIEFKQKRYDSALADLDLLLNKIRQILVF